MYSCRLDVLVCTTDSGTPFFLSLFLTWQLLCLPLVAACSSPNPTKPDIVRPMNPASPSAPSPPASAQRSNLPADAQVQFDPQTGTITRLQAKNLSARLEDDPTFSALQATARFADIAFAFLSAHRTLFRLQQPRDEFTVTSVQTDDLGMKHIRLRQTFAGLPVHTGDLIVHLDHANHVYLVTGRYIATPQHLTTTPQLTREGAVQKAAEHIKASASGCRNCRAELIIFAVAGKTPRLAYRVNVPVSIMEGWEVFVDAEQGSILEKIPTTLNLKLQR